MDSYGVLVALVKIGATVKLYLAVSEDRAAVSFYRINVLYRCNIYVASKMNRLHHEITILVLTFVTQVLHDLDFLLIGNKRHKIIIRRRIYDFFKSKFCLRDVFHQH